MIIELLNVSVTGDTAVDLLAHGDTLEELIDSAVYIIFYGDSRADRLEVALDDTFARDLITEYWLHHEPEERAARIARLALKAAVTTA